MESQQEPKVTIPPLIPLEYSNRVMLKTILECGDDQIGLFGKTVVVGGWVKSSKEVKREPVAAALKPPTAAEAFPPSPGRKELSCVEVVQSRIPFFKKIIRVFGVSSDSYPGVREKFEPVPKPPPPPPSKFFLQISDGSSISSLMVASITRICDTLDFAAHTFFHNHGFLHVQVPIITTIDSEGFSEKFQVTTSKKWGLGSGSDADVRHETVKAEQHIEARDKSKLGTGVKPEVKEDFFGRQSYLSVSGRLHLESYACALGNVYSFGPRFRAEKTGSIKQVAEMWVVEVEIAFSQLEDSMKCAEDCFKFLCKWILDHCPHDMKFVTKRIDKTIVHRLEYMMSISYERISYREAVDILRKVTDKTFETKLRWGVPLTAEHLSYLADDHYKRPVIIYDYPKAVKPFYVRLNDDGKTVAAFDMVVPKMGTVITGSQSEERLDMLSARMKEFDLSRDQYEWYQDLRKHGTVKHSGFRLGFDLMVLLMTGLTDVRDVVPFPRTHGKANN
ncbi:hypothetical protein ERO13_D07G095300v2 [Gossypium hirsutum]|nr:hypothetical protein ERO13_D07G095300v2 [Gossypium hirsutum]